MAGESHDIHFKAKQRDEAGTRECATLRFNGTRVQGWPCQGAQQGAHPP
jgi:hypothetical protein